MQKSRKRLSIAATGLLVLSIFVVASIPSASSASNPVIELLNSWFGAGGKYSKTPQVYTGQGSSVSASGTVDLINIGKPANVKITILAVGVGSDEKVRFFYDIDTAVVYEVVAEEADSMKTLEVCTHHCWISITGTVNLYYEYIYITGP